MRYPERNPVANVSLCVGYLMRQNFHISRFKLISLPVLKNISNYL